MKIAFLCPGQSAQKAGMGSSFPEIDEYLALADRTLSFSLRERMFEGPQEVLTETYHAQPALLTVGAVIADKLMPEGITPDFVAGHSLGEYTALVASGGLSYEDGVQTVYERGRHMTEAVPKGQGAMAAVIGGERSMIEEVTAQITSEGYIVQPANMNSPGQIVISGTKEGIARAQEVLPTRGARRVIPLDVSGPFHSDLMKDAANSLQQTFEKMTWHPLRVPLVKNIDASLSSSVEEVREGLIEQLYSPVEWERSMQTLLDEGVTHFIECGPGRVLKGLMRKIDRKAVVYTIEDETSFQEVIQQLKGEEE